MPLKVGAAVRLKSAPKDYKVVEIKEPVMIGEAPKYLVEWTDPADGEVHQRWFVEEELEAGK